MKTCEYDAIVVGSGATGGWAAKKLTEAGLHVVMLEAGHEERLDALDAAAGNARLKRQKIQGTNRSYCNEETCHLFVDDLENPYTFPKNKPFDWLRSRQVGGRSLIWNGVALRFSDLEFKCASHDGEGADWPISYDDLAPYYDEVEQFLGVYGSTENLPGLPDGKYAPPMALTQGEKRLKSYVEQRWNGRKVIPMRGIPRTPSLDEPWPMFSSPGSTIASAIKTGKLELRTDAVVDRIVMNRDGKTANGVAYIDASTRGQHNVSARVVVLCASAIESTRLLLNSAPPNGLANSSGVLGRYLMDHIGVVVVGRAMDLDGPLVGSYRGAVGTIVPNFRNTICSNPQEVDFKRGYQIKALVQRNLAGKFEVQSGCPVLLSACGEMLPRFENRVRLSKTKRDKWGIPVAHIECSVSENDIKLAKDAHEFMLEVTEFANFAMEHDNRLANLGRLIHEVGTARMGSNPSDSVLNNFNQCWDLPNVFVTDGSCFVSSAWQNPTLTMMAITARCCDHIVARFHDGRFS